MSSFTTVIRLNKSRVWAKVEELHLENRLKQDLITLEYILDYLMLIQYTRLNISAKNTPIFCQNKQFWSKSMGEFFVIFAMKKFIWTIVSLAIKAVTLTPSDLV